MTRRPANGEWTPEDARKLWGHVLERAFRDAVYFGDGLVPRDMERLSLRWFDGRDCGVICGYLGFDQKAARDAAHRLRARFLELVAETGNARQDWHEIIGQKRGAEHDASAHGRRKAQVQETGAGNAATGGGAEKTAERAHPADQ